MNQLYAYDIEYLSLKGSCLSILRDIYILYTMYDRESARDLLEPATCLLLCPARSAVSPCFFCPTMSYFKSRIWGSVISSTSRSREQEVGTTKWASPGTTCPGLSALLLVLEAPRNRRWYVKDWTIILWSKTATATQTADRPKTNKTATLSTALQSG